MLLIVALAGGAVLFANARRGRPASEKLRGQKAHVVLPSGSLQVEIPAFITQEYGAVKFMADASVIGLIAGDADKGNFLALSLSHAEAQPFHGGSFAPWIGDAYMECIATADSEKGRNWWALDTNLQLQSKPYMLTYAVARNTIPLISRVCVVGTNGVSDINLRLYGAFTGSNMKRFGPDLQAMFRSIVVNEQRTRERLSIAQN